MFVCSTFSDASEGFLGPWGCQTSHPLRPRSFQSLRRWENFAFWMGCACLPKMDVKLFFKISEVVTVLSFPGSFSSPATKLFEILRVQNKLILNVKIPHRVRFQKSLPCKMLTLEGPSAMAFVLPDGVRTLGMELQKLRKGPVGMQFPCLCETLIPSLCHTTGNDLRNERS